MLTLPIPLLISLLLGLLCLSMLALGLALLFKATRRPLRNVNLATKDDSRDRENTRETPVARRQLTWDEWRRDPAVLTLLLAGMALVLFPLAGRHLLQFAYPAGKDEPRQIQANSTKDLTQPDGTKIHVEFYGPANAPVLVFTHGWGTSGTEWYYAKRHLGDRFRLIVWDLPGLGQSAQPQDRNFTLEKMAGDLHTVLSLAGGRPVVLVGHSIGGMINLTFCRLYPELLGSRNAGSLAAQVKGVSPVAGIVQLDTSYTNPVRTTKNSDLSLALQKPVAEPILHAMIVLSPLVRLMNWLSYQSGLAYLQNAQSSFAGSETRGQLDLVSRYPFLSSPAVVARGTLAMFHWDATQVLPQINTPVLIIVGKQDTTTLPSASRHMHETISGSDLQLVDPSAHYGLLEQNQRYDAAIAQFASERLR